MLSNFIRANPARYEALKARLRDALPMGWATRSRLTEAINRLHQKYIEDYVFIHIPKCGGTSVERALGMPLLNHDTALERREKLGERRWNGRVKFAVARNPYDRIASMYFYWFGSELIHSPEIRNVFLRWLRQLAVEQSESKLIKELQPQYWWLGDESGAQIVDHICRIENINEEIKPVAAALGRDINVPRIKVNAEGADYDALFTEAAKDIVKRVYENDFERFGYTM